MIINGIDFGPIVPVRLTVRPSQAIERGACREGFNDVVDACCPEIRGTGLDPEGRYVVTSDPEISLADMIKAGVLWAYIVWTFRLLEGPEAERTLRLFAAACAAEVLNHFEAAYPRDSRPRACIKASVGYAHGTVTREQLVAADAAARAAARAAAWAAALDADAAADAAAWAASLDADADAAADAAAWDAARAASLDADADAAARAAAWAAAIMRQREILLTFVEVTP